MIKTFENFEHDNSKIWIIGVPSGEALQVDRDIHNELYKKKLISYSTKYSQIGFFIFDDKKLNEILKSVKKINTPKDIMIFDHTFGKTLMEAINDIINDYSNYVELYASGNRLGISFTPENDKNYYLEIEKSIKNYIAEIRLNGRFISKYSILNDDDLLRSIKKEMTRN